MSDANLNKDKGKFIDSLKSSVNLKEFKKPSGKTLRYMAKNQFRIEIFEKKICFFFIRKSQWKIEF